MSQSRKLAASAMDGLKWSLKGRLLTFNTLERFSEPTTNSVEVSLLDNNRLLLTGQDYLSGEYHRDDTAAGRITGSINYRVRMALPSDAVIQIRLVDASRMDEPSVLIASEIFLTANRQVPIPYRLYYDTADLEQGHRYQLQADIIINNQRRFTNTIATDVRNWSQHVIQNIWVDPIDTKAGVEPRTGHFLRVGDK